MKVIILGAGVIGVASAYYLAKKGIEVEVIDRRPGPALETSFANAGEISPGYASPWAGPGVPFKAVKWILDPYGPLRVFPRPDWYQIRWAWQMLLNCSNRRYEVNKARMMRLAHYSRECFIELRGETGIRYDDRQRGTLQLFRTKADLARSALDIAVLDRAGVPYELLDRDGCVAVEPGLVHVAEKIAGGLRLPEDETGDCYLFTRQLAELARGFGVKFRFETGIRRIRADGAAGITGVETDEGEAQADHYVVALGSFSPLLTRPLGLDLPIYPVKGYSLTIPVTDADRAPMSTILDERYKVALTRLGERIRVAGTAELSGYNDVLRKRRLAVIKHCVEDLFDGGGDLSRASWWTGLRPMTPDGTPLVGATRYRNLWLNTGHGTLGWTMSCGSGRVIADLIAGDAPAIPLDGLGLSRYRNGA